MLRNIVRAFETGISLSGRAAGRHGKAEVTFAVEMVSWMLESHDDRLP